MKKKKMKYKQTEMKNRRYAVQFYIPRPTSLTKEYQTRLIRGPTDHDMRSEENLKEMEEKKAPGIDNLTSDIMIHGGEESVKQITTLVN